MKTIFGSFEQGGSGLSDLWKNIVMYGDFIAVFGACTLLATKLSNVRKSEEG